MRRITPHIGRANPEIPTTLPRCVISGAVYRVDGTPVRDGTITFDSRVPQTISGTTVQPLIISTVTDATGQLQALTLVQNLAVQIVVSDNGVTYPPMAGLIPAQASADFNQTTRV